MTLSIAPFSRLPQTATVWAGARRSVNVRVNSVRHDLVLWTQPDGVRSFDIPVRGEDAEVLINSLLRAMQMPMPEFRAERPTAVYIESPTVWEREQLRAMGLDLLETPPHDGLNEAFATFRGQLSGPTRSYLAGSTPEAVGTFFAAARDYYLDAPWKDSNNEELLRINGLSTSPVWVTVLGAAQLQYGLGIYLHASSAVHMLQGRPDLAMTSGLLSVTFDRPDEIGPDVCEEVAAQGWPLAEPGRIPALLRCGPHAQRMGDQADLVLAIDAMAAVRRRLLHGDIVSQVPSGRTAETSWPVDLEVLRFSTQAT